VTWFNRDVTPDEEQAVAAFMARFSAISVPDSGIESRQSALWWKAQLLRRWDDQQKAAVPLRVMEPIQLGASLIAAALVFLWALPSLTSALSQVLASVRPII
jgi:hypothetical protein